jgi:hypothetical protein
MKKLATYSNRTNRIVPTGDRPVEAAALWAELPCKRWRVAVQPGACTGRLRRR